MASPLSNIMVIAAIQSLKSLHETIEPLKIRSKALHRLQNELQDLTKTLGLLIQINNAETSVLAHLQGPIDRCSQVCHEFEQSMKLLSEKSMRSFRDWAKMVYMISDINDFIDTIAGFKSTISIGIGTITMQALKISQQAPQDLGEVIQDTVYDLEFRLQQIEAKLVQPEALDYSTATTTAQDPVSLIQRPPRHCDAVVHVTNIAEPRPETVLGEEPAILLRHCLGCNILFCLWVLLASLSLAVGIWRSIETSDEGKGFTDAAYVVAVGGLIIFPIHNRHAHTCERKLG